MGSTECIKHIIKDFVMDSGISGDLIYWTKDEILHNESGPAVIFPDSSEFYIKNGLYDRADGPAIIAPMIQIWVKSGIVSNNNGSAVEVKDLCKLHYYGGYLNDEEDNTLINFQLRGCSDMEKIRKYYFKWWKLIPDFPKKVIKKVVLQDNSIKDILKTTTYNNGFLENITTKIYYSNKLGAERISVYKNGFKHNKYGKAESYERVDDGEDNEEVYMMYGLYHEKGSYCVKKRCGKSYCYYGIEYDF